MENTFYGEDEKNYQKLNIWISIIILKTMSNNVEIKKVDSQGRIVLPSDWRESDLKYSNEVFIIKEPGCLKIIPKQRVDLTKYFDKIDFEVEDEIFEEDWSTIETNLLLKKEFKQI